MDFLKILLIVIVVFFGVMLLDNSCDNLYRKDKESAYDEVKWTPLKEITKSNTIPLIKHGIGLNHLG